MAKIVPGFFEIFFAFTGTYLSLRQFDSDSVCGFVAEMCSLYSGLMVGV